MSETHLFALVHGLWGGPNHLQVIEQAIKDAFDDDSYHVLRPSNFAFFKTYDGIEVCGNKVIEALFSEIELLSEQDIKVTKISFVGYSLGGLIARYCIGELYRLGVFDKIEPVIFTTFATPHMGVRFWDSSIKSSTANFLGSTVLGQTGRDLFLHNSDMLLQLADPEDVYYKGLDLFQKKILLANIRNDRTVAFYTSYITTFTPFSKWSGIKLKYVDDTPHVSIGSHKPTAPRLVDLQNSYRVEELKKGYTLETVIQYSAILMVIMVILPFWIPVVFIATCFGTLQSYVRLRFQLSSNNLETVWSKIRSVLYGNSDHMHSKHHKSLKDHQKMHQSEGRENHISEMVGTILEDTLQLDKKLGEARSDNLDLNDFNAESDGESEAQSESESDYGQSSGSPLLENPVKVQSSNSIHNNDVVRFNFRDFAKAIQYVNEHFNGDSEVPLFTEEFEIPFDEDRKTIHYHLNQLDWIKIPVYIDTFNSHGGIIARRGVKTNPRGTATVYFWVSLVKDYLDTTQAET
ncbi:Phospholipase [Komagataella phaffii]